MSVQAAEILMEEGDALVRSAQYDEAVMCYARAVDMLVGMDDREARRLVGRALTKKASVFVSLDKPGEADAAYGALSVLLSGSDSVNSAVAARVALIRAQALFDAGRYDQAIVAADSSLALLGLESASSPDIRG